MSLSDQAIPSRHRLAPPVVLFLICLALPILFQLGTLRLSPYRVVLIVMLLPCLWGWFTGAAGRLRFPDLLVLGLAVWSATSFLVVHGPSQGIESAGIVLIETLAPYMLARCYIRSRQDFYAMVRVLAVIVFALAPFAIIETFTAWNGPIRISESIFQTYPDVGKPARWGLDRVQGPFEHPILFGVFAGSALALAVYTLGFFRIPVAAGLAVTAALSLSSGPLTALVVQSGMILWDRVFHRMTRHWVLLVVLAVTIYVAVDLISNRTPAEVFISYAAFNPETAYNRLLIWDWGWVNIWQNPWFGLGNNDWQRLWFMTASVDMFWIQRTMVHGLPVGLMNQLLFVTMLIGLVKCRSDDPQVLRCRTGIAICLVGFYLSGMTVHFWNATFVLYMFFIGSAVWVTACSNRSEVAVRQKDLHLGRSTPSGILTA